MEMCKRLRNGQFWANLTQVRQDADDKIDKLSYQRAEIDFKNLCKYFNRTEALSLIIIL